MLDPHMEQDRIRFGERLAVSFHRTLRVPEDGRSYPLPAGLGRFPILPLLLGGACRHVVPMHRREAMWIGFSGAAWKPNAVKVVVGGINAVTGLPEPEAEAGPGEPQDYLVCPLQPWLDGFNAGDGRICQFVAMPQGEGYGIEAGHGLAERGGIRITVFEPRPGRFPDAPPPAPPGPLRLSRPQAEGAMVLGAGGEIRQKLYRDPHGRDAWDPANRGQVEILLLDSQRYAALSGRPAPPSPVDAAAYAAAGLPWFALDDAAAPALDPAGGPPPRRIGEQDRLRGEASADARHPPATAPGPVVRLRRRPAEDAEDDRS